MRNARSYVFPSNLDEALAVVRSQPGRAAYLAGGTLLAERDDPGIETLVDLSHLGLEQVAHHPPCLRLGAMATLEQLRQSPQVKGIGDGTLAEALGRTRTQAWRNQATLGGRLREGDRTDLVLPVLLVLEARVAALRELHAPPECLPIEHFERLDACDLILGVDIDPRPGWHCVLESLHLSALDRPVAAVCVGLRLESGRVAAARVASCGLTARPSRAPQAEDVLAGAPAPGGFAAAQEAFTTAIDPADDTRASRTYRLHLGSVLLGRALRRAVSLCEAV